MNTEGLSFVAWALCFLLLVVFVLQAVSTWLDEDDFPLAQREMLVLILKGAAALCVMIAVGYAAYRHRGDAGISLALFLLLVGFSAWAFYHAMLIPIFGHLGPLSSTEFARVYQQEVYEVKSGQSLSPLGQCLWLTCSLAFYVAVSCELLGWCLALLKGKKVIPAYGWGLLLLGTVLLWLTGWLSSLSGLAAIKDEGTRRALMQTVGFQLAFLNVILVAAVLLPLRWRTSVLKPGWQSIGLALLVRISALLGELAGKLQPESERANFFAYLFIISMVLLSFGFINLARAKRKGR